MSASQLAEIAFMTGVGSDDRTNSQNFFTWSLNDPPTYTREGSAHKWQGGTAGSSGGVVRYFFDPNSQWTLAEKAGWQSAMALWSAVANVKFEQAVIPAQVTLTISRNSEGAANENQTGSVVPVGSSELGRIGSSVITYDPIAFGNVNDFTDKDGFGVGSVVHELGHTLGLGHGGPYDANVNAGTQQFGPFDSKLWTISSYIPPTDASAKFFNDYTVTGTDWGNNTQSFTWMPLDILAAQKLYGMPHIHPPLRRTGIRIQL